MAFGGSKEVYRTCPKGHRVREDRLPYHNVKFLCDASVGRHNPEGRLSYATADKAARKAARQANAQAFKEALGIATQHHQAQPSPASLSPASPLSHASPASRPIDYLPVAPASHTLSGQTPLPGPGPSQTQQTQSQALPPPEQPKPARVMGIGRGVRRY